MYGREFEHVIIESLFSEAVRSFNPLARLKTGLKFNFKLLCFRFENRLQLKMIILTDNVCGLDISVQILIYTKWRHHLNLEIQKVPCMSVN